MEVICLEDTAFYALIDKVVTRIKEKEKISEDKRIGGEEAMNKLRITSKTTLQNLGMKAKSVSPNLKRKSPIRYGFNQ